MSWHKFTERYETDGMTCSLLPGLYFLLNGTSSHSTTRISHLSLCSLQASSDIEAKLRHRKLRGAWSMEDIGGGKKAEEPQ